MNYTKINKIVLNTKEIIISQVSDIQSKGIGDFVTNIDLQVNNYLKQELNAIYPAVQFFSEEEDSKLTDNCWILDPIDGTANLVFGRHMSAVSLAHYEAGEIKYGIVFNPFSNEVFTSIRGQGAYLNHDKKLSVSRREFNQSIIEFGPNPYEKSNAAKNFQMGLEIFEKSLDIRCTRSAALAICHIAAARIDGYVEELLKPWDYAAGLLILEEAGGCITDFKANKLALHKPSSTLASNKINHEQLFNIVNKYYT